MRQSKVYLLKALLAAWFLAGCTTTEPTTDVKIYLPNAERPPAPPISEVESKIDYIGLEQTLHMDGVNSNLGYREKTFNTCEVGNGFAKSGHCERKYFAVIYFQLQCRDTDDTNLILSDFNIAPLANQDLAWSLSKRQGRVQTDSLGFAQIRMVFDQSAKEQRLKINLGRKFLYMEAQDITRVVSPASWCGI